MDSFFIQLQSASQTCTASEVAEDKKTKFADETGHYCCKHRAPFPIAATDEIDENGNWKQKWLYTYINGWIPGILINARCNNDGKFLTNSEDTKNVTAYMTVYMAKKQGQSHNVSAIMAKEYSYDLDHLQDTSANFVFSCSWLHRSVKTSEAN